MDEEEIKMNKEKKQYISLSYVALIKCISLIIIYLCIIMSKVNNIWRWFAVFGLFSLFETSLLVQNMEEF